VDRLQAYLGLPQGSTVCDVGAGSGNYTNALAMRGFRMIAIEPSATMRSQATPSDRVAWFSGAAESLPLPDRCCDGVVSTLAMHHYSDLLRAASEMDRVCRDGPIVLFTADPRESEPLWFEDYFPAIRRQDFALFPPVRGLVEALGRASGRSGTVHAFPLPPDLIDNFLFAPWARPELYLDRSFRDNTSGFARADEEEVARGLTQLQEDLANGSWDERFGHLRRRAVFDAGYRFIVLVRA
jgi:SAM-dependent methyltransferase